MNMNKQISIELLNKIANYLAGRPYIEVAQLIQEISQLQDVSEIGVKEPNGVKTSNK